MSYNSFFLFHSHSFSASHTSSYMWYSLNFFHKTLPWQLLSLYVLPNFTPTLACLYMSFSPCVLVPRESWLRYNIIYKHYVVKFLLKYFRRTSTLRTFLTLQISPRKILYNKNFSIYSIHIYRYRYDCVLVVSVFQLQTVWNIHHYMRTYPGFFRAPQPVKFSSEADLKKKECQELLQKYMPKNVPNTKIAQKVFIKWETHTYFKFQLAINVLLHTQVHESSLCFSWQPTCL